MIKFNSINSIVDDIIRIVRNSNISASENISRAQVESWIHQYRAKLLVEAMNAGYYPSAEFTQLIPAIEMVQVDFAEDSKLVTSVYRFRSSIKIPKVVSLHYGDGIVWLGDLLGNEIQLIPESRASLHKHKKWSKNSTVAYFNNGYLYINTCNLLDYIRLQGVFEVPSDLQSVDNPLTGDACYDPNDTYPVPAHFIPIIKQMIFERELGILVDSPTDITNDSNNIISPIVSA